MAQTVEASPQDRAISLALDGFAIVQQLSGMLEQVQNLANDNTQLGLSAIYNALPTAVTNADGSLGAADGTPNTGHAIDNRIVSRLNISVTAFQLGLMFNLFSQLANLLNGQAVTTQASAPAVLAAIGN
jgi:hypothetical protein